MKYFNFTCWPVVGRIRNGFVRCLLGWMVLVVVVCLVWFFANRGFAGFGAVKVETSAGADAAVFTGRVRVVTYNIAHGRGLAGSNWQIGGREAQLERLDQIAGLLRDQRADIVVLNEVDFGAIWTSNVNQAVYIAEKAGFPFVAEQRNFDMAMPLASLRWGNAILRKYPIKGPRLINFAAYANC